MWAIVLALVLGAVIIIAVILLNKKSNNDEISTMSNGQITFSDFSQVEVTDEMLNRFRDEDWKSSLRRRINEENLALMRVGCLCGGPCADHIGNTCLKCGKACTYQPTVNGRPLYRCEWSVLQKGPSGEKERNFVRQQLTWYWTCSVCGMEPLYRKSIE